MNGIATHANGFSHKNGKKSPDQVSYEDVQATAQHLLSLTSHRPRIGIICGSGLGGLVDMLKDTFTLSYEHVPHFPISTAPGHAGKLVFGELGGKSCMCMQGRVHLYEGYPPWKVVFPIRVMKAMGVDVLLATNAAGGLNDSYSVGDLMIFKDHVNIPGMGGNNPLVGPNDERFGPRFPPLSDAYDKELRALAKQAAKDLHFNFVHEGVYAVQAGPCFETVAECRLLKMLGADVTGMSTVPEVIAARHCGMRCFAMTLVTNMCVMDYESEEKADSDDVLIAGSMRSKDCQKMIAKIVANLPLDKP